VDVASTGFSHPPSPSRQDGVASPRDVLSCSVIKTMSGSGHLRIRIQTSASSKEVFAVLRGLTSARPESLESFSLTGVPFVSTHPPRFTIRVLRRGRRGDTPVAWAGELREAPAGSLIVARTNRAPAIWQASVTIAVAFATMLWAGSTGRMNGFWPLFVMSALISIVATGGWIQATRLREGDKRDALALLDVLMAQHRPSRRA
jgi:hypothetical protein